MPIAGLQFGGRVGPGALVQSITGSSANTYAMAALNAGVAFRFTALRTTAIVGVKVSWSSVTAAGTVKLQIETVDNTVTPVKPTGVLYDANASISFTPVAGVQTYTFATPPTTLLTVGQEYCVTLLTTVPGTTQTLRYTTASVNRLTSYPNATLTSATGQTPSSYAELASPATGLCSLVLSDATEETYGLCPYSTFNTSLIYATNAAAMGITTSVALNIAGIEVGAFLIVGTPAGDVTFAVYNSSGVVSGTSVTIDKDSLLGLSTIGKLVRILFPVVVALPAGTYWIGISSPDSINSLNAWKTNSAAFLSSLVVPNNFRINTTTNINANPIIWTPSTTEDTYMAFILDSFGAAASSGGIAGVQIL